MIKNNKVKKTILLTIENKDLRYCLGVSLLQEYDVNIAKNSMEALIMLNNGYHPDLMISDVNDKVVSGRTLTEHIKLTDYLQNIPVYSISDLGDAGNTDDNFDLGAADFITKPVGYSYLDNKIQKILLGVHEMSAV